MNAILSSSDLVRSISHSGILPMNDLVARIMNYDFWVLRFVRADHLRSDQAVLFNRPNKFSAKNYRPIIVDDRGFIIDGNHRTVAALEAGIFCLPAWLPL